MGMASVSRGSRSGHRQHWAAKCKTEFSQEFGEKGIPLEEDPADVNRRELQALEDFFGIEDGETANRGVLSFAANAFSSFSNDAKKKMTPEAAALKAAGMLWRRVHSRRAKLEAEEPEPAQPPLPAEPADKAATLLLPIRSKTSADVRPPPGPPSDTPSATPKSRPSRPLRAAEASPDSRGISLCDLLTPVGAAEHSLDGCEASQTNFAKHAQERIHRPVSPRELVQARPPAALSIADFPPVFRRAGDRLQETHYSYFTRHIPDEKPERRKAMEMRAWSTRRVLYGQEPWPLKTDPGPKGRADADSWTRGRGSASAPASPVISTALAVVQVMEDVPGAASVPLPEAAAAAKTPGPAEPLAAQPPATGPRASCRQPWGGRRLNGKKLQATGFSTL